MRAISLAWLAPVAVVVLGLHPLGAAAQTPRPVHTQVSRVALFKNGLGFFLRHGELPAEPGRVRIGPLPAAAHGTFWLSFDPSVKFSNLAAIEEKVPEQRDAVTIPELLRANVGKRVRLEFAGQPPSFLEGVIRHYSQPEFPQANPYMAGGPSTSPQGGPSRPSGEVVVVATDDGIAAVNSSIINRVVFLEEPTLRVAADTVSIALEGELTATAAEQPVAVSYLSKGITWVPSYVVDISQPNEALLSAKAEIINEIEDLDNVHVDLVTGFPYLQFGDIITPLAKKEDLSQFLTALGRGYSEGRRPPEYAGVAMQQRSDLGARGPSGPPPTPIYGSAAAGVSAEDLFLYPLDGVTLKRNSVGYYPLFTERVAYEHIYEWDIPDYVSQEDRYQERPAEEKREIVWHSLRLKNSTRVPWTTAPAETMQNGQILGQATLNYTPVGGETVLKITQALGIQAEETELETEREIEVVRRYGSSYDRVTIEGELRLKNFVAEKVTVRITKTLTGEVQTSAPEARVEKLAKGLRQENPRSRLTWQIVLESGEEKEISYVYTVLIRR